jgi:hypothetical protein
MSEVSVLPRSTPPSAQAQPFACRLRRKEVTGRRGPRPFMAEVEIENLANSVFEIEYQMAVLQYLNLIVCDAHGVVVSEGHYGDRFSPFERPIVLRLGPGEKYRAEVHLFATMPRRPIAPATYFVHALYEYNGFRAESEPVEVTVEKSIE